MGRDLACILDRFGVMGQVDFDRNFEIHFHERNTENLISSELRVWLSFFSNSWNGLAADCRGRLLLERNYSLILLGLGLEPYNWYYASPTSRLWRRSLSEYTNSLIMALEEDQL